MLVVLNVLMDQRYGLTEQERREYRQLYGDPWLRCPKLSGQGSNRILIWKGTGSSAGEAETIHSRV
jgi:hypothetical protein